MPKLSATQAKTVSKIEPQYGNSTFEPHPPGLYLAKLAYVEAKTSANGNPMWSVEWDSLRTLEGEELPGKMFFNLNFPTSAKRPAGWGEDKPNARKSPDERWAAYQERCKALIHGFFLAHGYTVDSDTDEMIGEDCILDVGVETQQQGKNAGTLRNVVNGFKPVDEETAAAAGADEEDEEDEF